MNRRSPSPEHRHRAEPRLLPWLRPNTAQGVVLAAVAGATALGGAGFAATTLANADADLSMLRADAPSSTVPVSLHDAPSGTTWSSRPVVSRSGTRLELAERQDNAAHRPSRATPTHEKVAEVTLATPSGGLSATVEVTGDGSANGSAGSSSGGSSTSGGSAPSHDSPSGGDAGGSDGGGGDEGGSPTPAPSPVPSLPTPDLPTPSINVAS